MIKHLNAAAPVSPARLATVAARVAGDPNHWSGLVRYDPARRWYRRLDLADDHEVWLLTWLPGQQTGFHDHGDSAGAFAVVLGTLTERSAPGGRPEASGRVVAAGGVRSFGRDYVHDVRNDSPAPALSIHAYSPPLTIMRRFAEASGALRLAGVEVTSW